MQNNQFVEQVCIYKTALYIISNEFPGISEYLYICNMNRHLEQQDRIILTFVN